MSETLFYANANVKNVFFTYYLFQKQFGRKNIQKAVFA